jgi:hypothetical protein
MNTDTKIARKGNHVNATRVGSMIEKGYRYKLVKLKPVSGWLEGKVYRFGCESMPTSEEIYTQLNLLPKPENLPRSKSGKKVRRHQNARVLIDVLNEIHRCYELGDLLPHSWREVADYLKKCSYDLDALPGLFDDASKSWTESEGLDPATITDSKETHSLQLMEMIEQDNWKKFLDYFGEDLSNIKNQTIEALEDCNMHCQILKIENPELASKLALGYHKKFRQFIAEVCAKLTINE